MIIDYTAGLVTLLFASQTEDRLLRVMACLGRQYPNLHVAAREAQVDSVELVSLSAKFPAACCHLFQDIKFLVLTTV